MITLIVIGIVGITAYSFGYVLGYKASHRKCLQMVEEQFKEFIGKQSK